MKIVAIPSSLTGSVGVFMLHEDWSAALEKEGIKLTAISAGDFKLELAPWTPLSDDAKSFLQNQVDTVYNDFVKAVARGRGLGVQQVRDNFGQGRMFDAKQALNAQMIDAIETIPQALSRIAAGKRVDGSQRAAWLERDDVRALENHAPLPTAEELEEERRRKADAMRLVATPV